MLTFNPDNFGSASSFDDGVLLFQTRVAGQARTCGVVAREELIHRPVTFQEIANLRHRAHHNLSASARGKVALLRADGLHTFQTDLDGKVASVWCGNATAAGAVVLGAPTLTVHGPDGRRCEVEVAVAGKSIGQRWILDEEDSLQEARWRGRPVVQMNALNRYAIVGELPPEISPENARKELVGDALGAKLIVITTSPAGPVARFFNSNGEHGSLPQTGIASLAIAKARCTWLAALFSLDRVAYRAGTFLRIEALPRVQRCGSNRIQIALPPTEVDLGTAIQGAQL